MDSDDSELDDFGVRTPLNSPAKKSKSSRSTSKKLSISTSDKKKKKTRYVESESDNDEDNESEGDEESQSSPAKALFGRGTPSKSTPKRSHVEDNFEGDTIGNFYVYFTFTSLTH